MEHTMAPAISSVGAESHMFPLQDQTLMLTHRQEQIANRGLIYTAQTNMGRIADSPPSAEGEVHLSSRRHQC
jgi:hypothetical protein